MSASPTLPVAVVIASATTDTRHVEAAKALGFGLRLSGYGVIGIGSGQSGLLSAVQEGYRHRPVHAGKSGNDLIKVGEWDRTPLDPQTNVIALPGGPEEAAATLDAGVRLYMNSYDAKPVRMPQVVLVNHLGAFNPLLAMLENIVQRGFAKESVLSIFLNADDGMDAIQHLDHQVNLTTIANVDAPHVRRRIDTVLPTSRPPHEADNGRNGLNKIAFYTGSSHGVERIANEKTVIEFAEYLALRGKELVYGGGTRGLMGLMATSFFNQLACTEGTERSHDQASARIHGFTMPHFIQDSTEGDYAWQSREIVCRTLRERKQSMFDQADALVVGPGGYGTLDEMMDAIARNYRLAEAGHTTKPILLVNENGYYDPFIKWLDQMVEEKQAGPSLRQTFMAVPNLTAAQDLIDSISSDATTWVGHEPSKGSKSKVGVARPALIAGSHRQP